jgi:hypothetical protein
MSLKRKEKDTTITDSIERHDEKPIIPVNYINMQISGGSCSIGTTDSDVETKSKESNHRTKVPERMENANSDEIKDHNGENKNVKYKGALKSETVVLCPGANGLRSTFAPYLSSDAYLTNESNTHLRNSANSPNANYNNVSKYHINPSSSSINCGVCTPKTLYHYPGFRNMLGEEDSTSTTPHSSKKGNNEKEFFDCKK